MGEPGAVIVPFVENKDLGLVFESPEGRGMDNSVTVALEQRPALALRFVVETAAAGLGSAGIRSKVEDGVHTARKLPTLSLSGNHPLAAEGMARN
jgi:hypothetical protein